MKCVLCEKEVEDIDAAIEAGWIPSFYVGDIEYAQCCDACFVNHLQFDGDGEYELKLEYIPTFLVSSSARPENLVHQPPTISFTKALELKGDKNHG